MSLPCSAKSHLRVQGWTWMSAVASGLLAYNILTLGYAGAQGIWLTDALGRPIARDFGCFWSAGRLALQGHGAQVYQWKALQGLLETVAPGAFANTAFPFLYPPILLLLLAPLGALSYLGAATVWIGGSLLAYLCAARLITTKLQALLLAAAAPAVMFPVWIGQNGLLTAALLGSALALIDRRPIVAGMLIGALAYKPQLGLLAPVALIAGARWRVVVSATISVVVLSGVSALLFGTESYVEFFRALVPTPTRFGVLGALPAAKLQSVYGLMLFAGAPPGDAGALQACISLAGMAGIALLWRSDRAIELKGAGLAATVLLVSPYSCIYDLPVTIIALLFLIRDARNSPLSLFQTALLALAWTAPMLFVAASFPVGPLVCILLCAVVAARCHLKPYGLSGGFVHRIS